MPHAADSTPGNKTEDADRDQHRRFLAAAREHGCEENVGRLDEVVRRVAKMPPPRREPRGGKKKSGA